MESAIRGLVLDSTVLVAAERAQLTTPEVLRNIRRSANAGDVSIVISVLTVAELGHGIARVGGEQSAKGINLPLIDLMIGACALELGYAIGTDNERDFNRIPDLRVIIL
jgi:predicted nucleic acid-binding protein